jgi:hypothetical protein
MISSMRGPATAALAMLLAAGCLFPEYTFDEPEPSGGGGGGSATITTSTGLATGGGGAAGTGGFGGDGGDGGSPPVEDCFAPGDEDDSGAADCADPACDVDLECVDAIPVGWGGFGYTALHQGNPTADPPCPAGTTTEVYAGNDLLINDAAACTTCDCDDPTGQSCNVSFDYDPVKAGIQPIRVRNVACSNPNATNFVTLTAPVPWDGTCTATEAAPAGGTCMGNPCNQSIEVALATVSGGSCLATGGTPVMTTPTWAEGSKACRAATTLTGCDGGQACVLRPPSPYDDRVCIGKAGNLACPGGAFSDRHVFFGDFVDTRNCTMCTCGGATGGVCTVTVGFHSDAGLTTCNTDLVDVPSGSCVDLAGNPRVSGRTSSVTTAPVGGGCAVTGGGAPTGAVTETDPTTFCCLPTQ